MQSEIQGQLERVTYFNEQTGYTVAKMRVKGYRDLVTFSGNLVSVNPGEVLKLKGNWYHHPKYGEQFKVNSYVSVVPATVKGIKRYLSSGLIKGIGPVMAKRIVSIFGIATLDIIENSIDRLREVDGIGDKRINMIQDAWKEQRDIKDVMLFLQDNGISSAYATKIYKQYGQESINIVKENPYRLASDVAGIGFTTADKIAQNMGIEKDSLLRAEAGILYVLQKMSGEGNVYYPYGLLLEESIKILGIDRHIIKKAFGTVAFEKRIIIENIDNGVNTINNKAVYLPKYYVSETGIVSHLKRLLGAEKRFGHIDMDRAIDWVQGVLQITLAQNQVNAVKGAIHEKTMIITGGPGTGKTTLINSIIKIYERDGLGVSLAAPTGRASKRLSEATGCEAKTIHRLLEVDPKEGKFKKNEKNPIATSLIVIDEASMLDTVLMYHFLRAVPGDATLILVGDINQLPSIGAGNVLKDFIESCVVPVVTLNKIFRQSMESVIVVNAHRINNGQMPILTHKKETLQDFYFIQQEVPEKIVEEIVSLCKERIPEKFQYDPVKDIQVLTAMHRGILGASSLNKVLQSTLNPSSVDSERKRSELIHGNKKFKKNDKVMQIVNNYDKDIFNGDIGIIINIDSEYHEVTVDFNGKYVTYDHKDFDEIVLAYAISVHKSQGSEYPVVVMPVHTQHYMLLQRNLLYTAITRGKKLMVFVGTKKALAIAVKNNKQQERFTYLKNRLLI